MATVGEKLRVEKSKHEQEHINEILSANEKLINIIVQDGLNGITNASKREIYEYELIFDMCDICYKNKTRSFREHNLIIYSEILKRFMIENLNVREIFVPDFSQSTKCSIQISI